jgi:tRNA threonylcarbamoyl adenosine modification protein YjeE
MQKTLTTLDDTKDLAQEVLASLSPDKTATVLALSGDLGAGKTTFTQFVAQELGVTETVVSPTFVIAKFYELTNQQWERLVHIDAYRLESWDELAKLKFNEYFRDPKNLIIVEWPEQLVGVDQKDWRVIQSSHGKKGAKTAYFIGRACDYSSRVSCSS